MPEIMASPLRFINLMITIFGTLDEQNTFILLTQGFFRTEVALFSNKYGLVKVSIDTKMFYHYDNSAILNLFN